MDLKAVTIDGNKIRALREAKNLSLQAVASQVGVERGTVHNYEKGNAKPSSDVAARLCIFFGISIEEITNLKNFSSNVSY